MKVFYVRSTPGGVMISEKKGREAAGLVHSSTSGPTGLGVAFQVDPVASRMRRMKCATITSARLLQEELQKGSFRYKVAMVTLTYAMDDFWQQRHISLFLQSCRKYLRRRGHTLRYTWVAELTKRGRVHYHVLIWLPKGLTLPKPDKVGWWPYGMTKIEWARNAVGYIAKYASKGLDTLKFPKGLRLYGSGGLQKESQRERRWWLLPVWLRESFEPIDDVIRAIGGGFVARRTGEWLPSPFVVTFEGGFIMVRKKV